MAVETEHFKEEFTEKTPVEKSKPLAAWHKSSYLNVPKFAKKVFPETSPL